MLGPLIRRQDVKTPAQEVQLQASIQDVEKKPLPHLLCTTNMIVHGIDVPTGIRHDNTLARPLRDISMRDRVDVVLTNPPFGGMEEDGIERNFNLDIARLRPGTATRTSCWPCTRRNGPRRQKCGRAKAGVGRGIGADGMTLREFIAAFDVIAEAPGGIERLRELVLQLAVRGRLVRQDLGEEPASRLLEHIAQERERLERAREIGRQKPVLPLDPSAIAVELPSGWTWTCTAALGILNPRNVAKDDAIVSFCPMPVIPTDYRQRVVPETRSWGDIKKGYTHFADGDVVVAKITPCFQNRKSCVMSGLEGGIGAGTTELHVIRIIANKVVPEYLLLFYKSPNFLQSGVAKMTGTAGQQRVPREYFAYTPLLLPLPPLTEQHRKSAEDFLRFLAEQDRGSVKATYEANT